MQGAPAAAAPVADGEARVLASIRTCLGSALTRLCLWKSAIRVAARGASASYLSTAAGTPPPAAAAPSGAGGHGSSETAVKMPVPGGAEEVEVRAEIVFCCL